MTRQRLLLTTLAPVPHVYHRWYMMQFNAGKRVPYMAHDGMNVLIRLKNIGLQVHYIAYSFSIMIVSAT